ncbi:MAG: DUF4388 domain-containing protein, partial [Coriobacteriia bacterium]|nr:DUF4388 domain-containing protein [Coriobacteriia bacterium]
MALRGNLKDFSLPDVFQLIQLSGKTGVLRIVGPAADGSIWFRGGEVFFAQSNWRRELLGERLVAAQRITPAALAKALEIRAAEGQGGRRLGQILVDEGYITQQVLETLVQEQIQDTVFDLMRWDEGDFDFEVLPEVVDEDIGLSVSVENIVMEGSRRLEEWQRIKKRVPSTDMVFKMATAPGEGTFEISLKPVEWGLLLLIDGTRSVTELATETHSTDFEVARVVYGLFSAGLLEVASDEEVGRLRAERSQRESRRVAVEGGQVVEGGMPAAAPPAPQPQEAPEAGTGGPRRSPEEPEFLSAGAAVPSADDMVAFQEMMQSVLSPEGQPVAIPGPGLTPQLEPEPEPEQEEPPGSDFEVQTPYVPSPEPAAGGEGEAREAWASGTPAPPVDEGRLSAEGAARSGDFEKDLRSLGLGELPEELAQPGPPSEARLAMWELQAGRIESPASSGVVSGAELGQAAADADLDSIRNSLDSAVGPSGGQVLSDEDDGL